MILTTQLRLLVKVREPVDERSSPDLLDTKCVQVGQIVLVLQPWFVGRHADAAAKLNERALGASVSAAAAVGGARPNAPSEQFGVLRSSSRARLVRKWRS
ncbi:hypothetical protein MTO96_022888 [Rhipicephalus appendiculatus]